MSNQKTIKRVGYGILLALLALVFYLVYDGTHHETSEVVRLFSGCEISVIRIGGIGLGVCAAAMAVFFVVRAFYLGFTRPNLQGKEAPQKSGLI